MDKYITLDNLDKYNKKLKEVNDGKYQLKSEVGEVGGKINIGNVQVNTLESGTGATVTVEERVDATDKKTYTDFTFGIPKGEKGTDGQNGVDGAAGEKGEKGDTGLEALITTNVFNHMYTPAVNSDYTINLNYFSRTPLVGESFNLIWKAENTNETYIVIAAVKAISDNIITMHTSRYSLISGPQGPAGAAGKDALVSKSGLFNLQNTAMTIGSSYTYNNASFNREPIVGDTFNLIVDDLTNKVHYYACFSIVAAEVSGSGEGYYDSIIKLNSYTQIDGPQGVQGVAGKDALMYSGGAHYSTTIPSVNSTYNFLQSSFNRTPMEGDTFLLPVSTQTMSQSWLCRWVVVGNINSSQVTCKVLAVTETTGAQGEAGAAGKDALVYIKVISTSDDTPPNDFTADSTSFNRTPVIGDICQVIVTVVPLTGTTTKYFCYYKVSSVTDDTFTLNRELYYTISGEKGDTGAQGEAGKDALIFNGFMGGNVTPEIGTTYSTFPISSFNRTPVVGDNFLGVVTTSIRYLCMFEVTEVGESSVTGKVLTSTSITGKQGEKGDQGDPGKPMLACTESSSSSSSTATPETTRTIAYVQFNRTPEVGDSFLYFKDVGYPTIAHVYLCIYKVTAVDGTNATCTLVRYRDVKGVQGEKGDTGAQGEQGIQGEKGDPGDKGETGPAGQNGVDGLSVICLGDGNTESVPEVGGTTVHVTSKIDPTPVTNQFACQTETHTSTGDVYFVVYKFTEVDETNATATIVSVQKIGNSSSKAQGVEISLSGGTLTTEQLNILKASDENYVYSNFTNPNNNITYETKFRFINQATGTNAYTQKAYNYRRYAAATEASNALVNINLDDGTYEFFEYVNQKDLSMYCRVWIDSTSGTDSGELSDENVQMIDDEARTTCVILSGHNIQLNFVDMITKTVDNVSTNYRYYSTVKDGIEYDLACNTTDKTWILTKHHSSQAVGIELTTPTGTLTTEQLDVLKASNENYITINMGGEGSRKLDYYANYIVDNVESRVYSSTIGITNFTITVNMSTGAYTFRNSNYQDDMSDYYIVLSGNSGTLTDEQVENIEYWQQLGKIKQLTHDIWLNFAILVIDSSSGSNIRHLYFTGIKDGIEYDIKCNTTAKTWSLTKQYLEIEVPLNDDFTISDEALALIEKYGEHTYVRFDSQKYTFNGSSSNHTQYTTTDGANLNEIFIITDTKTWEMSSRPVPATTQLFSGFKLTVDGWEASESINGSYTQTIAFNHTISDSILYTVLPSSLSLKMWAECGVGAFEETNTTITFYAQSRPTDSLSFSIKDESVMYTEV